MKFREISLETWQWSIQEDNWGQFFKKITTTLHVIRFNLPSPGTSLFCWCPSVGQNEKSKKVIEKIPYLATTSVCLWETINNLLAKWSVLERHAARPVPIFLDLESICFADGAIASKLLGEKWASWEIKYSFCHFMHLAEVTNLVSILT